MLYVHLKYRRRRISVALMAHMEDRCKTAKLEWSGRLRVFSSVYSSAGRRLSRCVYTSWRHRRH